MDCLTDSGYLDSALGASSVRYHVKRSIVSPALVFFKVDRNLSCLANAAKWTVNLEISSGFHLGFCMIGS
jgi:hypothetical protein